MPVILSVIRTASLPIQSYGSHTRLFLHSASYWSARIMEERVVAITGGASGIGLSTAKLIASKGAKVSVADVCDQKELDRALASIQESAQNKSDVMTCRCDVSVAKQVTEWLEATKKKWGRIDHVVNAAGVWSESEIGKIKKVDWDRIIAVNLEVRAQKCWSIPIETSN